MSPRLHHIIREEREHSRFDLLLAEVFPDWSRRQLRSLLRSGKVLLNGQPAQTHSRALAGDCIELLVPCEHGPALRATIIQESERYIYLHKPSGMHSTALYPGQANTLATQLQQRHPRCARASSDPRDGGAIHRLDALTSGVIAVAKDPAAYLDGRRAMSQGQLLKLYLAVCEAHPRVRSELCQLKEIERPPQLQSDPPDRFANWTALSCPSAMRLHAPLGKGRSADKVAVHARGRSCSTSLVPLARQPERPRRRLYLLALQGGMRHQLRVHLAALGVPILHDPLYGPRSSSPLRLALHAWRLDLGALDERCGPVTAKAGADFLQAAEAEPLLL